MAEVSERCMLEGGAADTAFAEDQDTVDSVTCLLADAGRSEDEVWDRIYVLIYPDLQRIARSQIRQQLRPGLSPTSLISETWIKLARSHTAATCRPHLVSLIARAMRFVLLDEARRVLTAKRRAPQGGETLSLSEMDVAGEDRLEEMLALDKALEILAGINSRLARVVELRYFGGMEEAEIAEILDLTVRTVRRDWRKARAFLHKHLQ